MATVETPSTASKAAASSQSAAKPVVTAAAKPSGKKAPAKAAKATPVAKPTTASPKASAAAKPVTAPAKKNAASKPAAKPAAKAPTKPASTAAKPAVKAAAKSPTAKPAKEKKVKLVRDSFTMPKTEFVVLEALKLRAGKLSTSVKKTELLRAGIKALAAMGDAAFLAAVRAVPSLKTGRPVKTK
jgi:hypothetical protein